MARKRGSSGLSFVIGVNKPVGMSSHDVVNRVRRIFDERRVGHTGTLDPAASGALLVCVGPATRLDAFMVGHDKRYVARFVFGVTTDTDDAEGEVVARSSVPSCVRSESFAREFVRNMRGRQNQLPPVYSALKVGGKKACDEARRGNVIDLKAREIEIYDAEFLAMGEEDGLTWWDLALHVSSGTYVRAVARDAGLGMGTVAHLAKLERVAIGGLTLDDCVTLETLEEVGVRAELDPVRLLKMRFAFAREDGIERRIANGNALRGDMVLYEQTRSDAQLDACACTSGVVESCRPPEQGENVAVIARNKLVAIYRYDAARDEYRSVCVFNVGVARGADI